MNICKCKERIVGFHAVVAMRKPRRVDYALQGLCM